MVFGLSWAQIKRPVDEGQTAAGLVRLTIINHASFMVENADQVIHVDPVGENRYEGLPQADVILITHTHGDHLDPAAIARLRKNSTLILGPEAAAKSVPGLTVMRNGDTRTAGPTAFEAVPAYNLPRAGGGQIFHPKGEGNGYIMTFGGLRCYVAGDTQATPEMLALKDITVAFLPMNQPFTMTPEEVAAAARAFKPKILYPYHYLGSDTAALVKLLEGSGIDVRIRDWYY
ncbi:MAG: MBL fold metallo-hydrolase [Bryobacterales bacterium]|nr:MBL fold metallo-hydrolase [Bryobacterales bacterium]